MDVAESKIWRESNVLLLKWRIEGDEDYNAFRKWRSRKWQVQMERTNKYKRIGSSGGWRGVFCEPIDETRCLHAEKALARTIDLPYQSFVLRDSHVPNCREESFIKPHR